MLYMRNLAGLLHRRAQMAASAPAVGVGNRVHQSFGQLSLRSAQLAETLRSEHGLSAGDTVALVAWHRCNTWRAT